MVNPNKNQTKGTQMEILNSKLQEINKYNQAVIVTLDTTKGKKVSETKTFVVITNDAQTALNVAVVNSKLPLILNQTLSEILKYTDSNMVFDEDKNSVVTWVVGKVSYKLTLQFTKGLVVDYV